LCFIPMLVLNIIDDCALSQNEYWRLSLRIS